MLTRPAKVPVFALLAAGLTGCGQIEQQVVEASVQSALETSRNSGIGKLAYESVEPKTCLDPAAAAAEAAARPSVGVYPSSCAEKVASGDSLHVELDDCTGAFGRVHLNGGIDADFSSSACDRLHADVVDSGDLTVNDRALEYGATAEITVDGALRNVAWAGHWSTTTRRGKEIAQTSDLDLVIDTTTDCLTVDGTARGHWGDYDFDKTIEGLQICPDACPSAGTVRAEIEGWAKDRSLVIEFDGSEIARVTGTDGELYEVTMVCSGDADQ